MNILRNKIDFLAIATVDKANPNGDPLNGNRPREDYDGYGEISDVCLKRKIRNRLQDMGEKVFVISNERRDDDFKSLYSRSQSIPELKEASEKNDKEKYASIACSTWMDVRAFGQVFAFKKDKMSLGIRGPVSIHPAVSTEPIVISDIQITRSTNSDPNMQGNTEVDDKGSETMGTKHRVEFGVYIIKGSINVQLAEKTGFSEEDAEKIKKALATLFENDASSARPEGSMEIKKLYWWKHNCPSGQYSSAKVHRSVEVKRKEGVTSPRSFEDYEVKYTPLEGLDPEIIEGQ